MTAATLPADIKDFDSLKVADEAAKNSRSLFLAMLLACVYSWLTLASTTDQALIMNSGSSPLPIIRVPVPIRGFFLAAPAFLLGAYVYFHLYLDGLWERLATLPAVFPDGKPLDERAYPWLLTSLVRPSFARLRDHRPRFSKVKVGLSIFLAWYVVPLTIYLFWAQALAAHVWYLTALHLGLVVGAIGIGMVTYRGAVSTLRLGAVLEGRSMIWHVAWWGSPAARGMTAWSVKRILTVSAAILMSLSASALWGPVGRPLPRVPVLLRPYADLTNTPLTTRSEPRFLGDSVRVDSADFRGLNLRLANMRRVDLVEAQLDSADLTGANLTGAYLFGADLTRAGLTRANLTEANLTGADLTGANVAGVLTDQEGFWQFARSAGAMCARTGGALVEFDVPTDGGIPKVCVR